MKRWAGIIAGFYGVILVLLLYLAAPVLASALTMGLLGSGVAVAFGEVVLRESLFKSFDWIFFGIVCGLAVMLFSFGPGMFFLYARPWEKLHPQKKG